jgi:2,5-diketo-D-gluconate reductase B
MESAVMKLVGPIPHIGFGTWKRNGDDGYRAVLDALEVGYRHIDTAEAYDNEQDVGKAISLSRLKREDLFITTKVAPDNLGPGLVLPHVESSLDKLGLSQVDLLLIHWPSINDNYDVRDYVAQFAAVHQAGLTKHIGVSNFTKRHLAAAIDVLGEGVIATNQVEVHPFFQNPIMTKHCGTLNIPLTAYSPLARGAVNTSEVILRIATKHGATAGQVALAFLLAEGHVVIPTSSNKTRMAENLNAQNLALDTTDVTDIRHLHTSERLVNGSWAPVWDVE